MNKERIELLDKTLNRAIDWLKFAEAKNGALIAVGCATIFGVSRAYSSVNDASLMLTFYVSVFLVLAVASVVLALMSFIPRVEPPFWVRMPEKSDTDNPLFFAHSCKHSKGSYIKLINELIEPSPSDSERLEMVLCDQIVNNSRIAYIKYSTFGTAIFLFLAGILTPVGAALLYLVRK